MKLEHGKRYVTRAGMITPPLNERFNGISFDAGESKLLWSPEGQFKTGVFILFASGADPSKFDTSDLDIVAEATGIIVLHPQQYKNCQIDRGDHGGWKWVHKDYDGAPDAFGTDCNGNDVPDRRHGRCASVEECMAEINEMFEGAEK